MIRRGILLIAIFLVLGPCKNECGNWGDSSAQRETALKHDLREMRKALDDFYADKNRHPRNLTELSRMRYLRRVPVDPVTGSARTWIEVRKDGYLINIRSGAKGFTCGGTRYDRL